jgi:ADP-ribosyl-[dinitrogen reductase] hydrolase
MYYAPKIKKCINMMLGIAIGDAYGGPFENMPRKRLSTLSLEPKYGINPKKNNLPGHYTDDTQMSIAVSEILFSNYSFTKKNLAGFFVEAFKRDLRPGYSKKTKFALKNSNDGEDFLNNVQKNSISNGSTMRSVPYGINNSIEDLIEKSVINSEISHNTPQAIAASSAISLASYFFSRTNEKKEDLFDFVLINLGGFDQSSINYLYEVSKMKELDEKVLFGKGRDGVPINGLRTAGACLYLLKNYDNTRSVLNNSILLGGDTDTTAAIATGIAASRYGIRSIPYVLLENLENGKFGKDYLIETGKKLASTLPIYVDTIDRLNYPGNRKKMVVHGLDGLIQPVDKTYVQQIMTNLIEKCDYKKADVIIGVDSSGYIPAYAASVITDIPLLNTKKAELDIENKIKFLEPGTPHPEIFLYEMPSESNVIIIDDEIMTGSTVVNLTKSLRSHGHNVLSAIVPIESTSYNARDRLNDLGINLISHTKHDLK